MFKKKKLVLLVFFLFSFFTIMSNTFAASLTIKRNFTKFFNTNSQNTSLLTPLFFNKYKLFGEGGASVFSSSNGIIVPVSNASISQKSESHSQKEIDRKIKFYTVVKGDTISVIAKKFNISQNTLTIENNISNGKLKIGKTLTILPISGLRHKIVKNDNLWTIAKKYKADRKKIQSFNGLTSNILKVGSKIIIPNGKKPKASSLRKYAPRKIGSDSYNKNTAGYLNWRGIVPYGKGAKISVPKRRGGRYKYTQTNYGYFAHPAPSSVRTQGPHHRNAVDMGAPTGTKIYAAADGVVIKSSSGSWGGGYGNHMLIKHPNGIITMYAHLSRNMVWKGEVVKRGQLIGKMGNTGRSTGPHLHFEVRGAYNPF